MSERKISKALRKDRESTVSAVDIKSLTSSESTFSLRPLKVGRSFNDFVIVCLSLDDLCWVTLTSLLALTSSAREQYLVGY